MPSSALRARRLGLAGALLLLAGTSTLFAAQATRPIDRTFAATPGRSLSLLNLAGNVTVVKSSGSEIRLSGTVHAEADTEAEAERLAGLLSVQVDDGASQIAIRAKYPLETYRRYSYPRTAEEQHLPWFLEWLDIGNVSSKYDGVTVHVVSKRSASAPTLFADFRLEVPAGVAVSVDDLIGELRATGVESDVRMELGSGLIDARDGRGALSVDTGSGDIEIRAHQGKVRAETGSGDVRLEQVAGGDVSLETGSGDVKLVDVRANLSAETGSGDVVAEGLVAGAQLAAETGSGDIRIAGDFSAVSRLDISTGSGDVTLTADRAPDVRLAISTGSGDITLDLPSARVTRSDRSDVRAEIGAATGSGSISTGSGDVRIRSRG